MTLNPTAAPRPIVLVLHPDLAATDAIGPMEAFGLANYKSGQHVYELMTATIDGLPVRVAGSYVQLTPTHRLADLPERIDTMLIAGGPRARHFAENGELVGWLKAIAPRCARLGSVCNGTYLLCATGLTAGQTVATHWFDAADVARLYPETRVDADALFVNSGKIWSSAGMTSGTDLALAMIEADLGRKLALDVARHLVLYLKRPGGQTQFSMHLKAQFADVPAIERVQQWILDHVAEPLSIDELAEVARVSNRTLLRTFKDKTGTTVGDYIAEARLRHACGLLEHSDKGAKEIATLSGLGTQANMRKVFLRHLGIVPNEYRERFHVFDAPQAQMSKGPAIVTGSGMADVIQPRAQRNLADRRPHEDAA